MPFGKGEEGVGDLLLLVWLDGVHGGSAGPYLSAEQGWGVEILIGAKLLGWGLASSCPHVNRPPPR